MTIKNLRRIRGVTFMETMTVIGIILILTGILYNASSGAIASGKQTSCASRMRQVYVAMDLYCQDNGGWEKPLSSLAVLSPYAPKEVFRCPSEDSLTPDSQGLYPAEVLFLDPNVKVSYPISYAYVHDYGNFSKWDTVMSLPHTGVISCQWHGSLTAGLGNPMLKWMQPRTGPIQRICFDGHLFVWQRHRKEMVDSFDVFFYPDFFKEP